MLVFVLRIIIYIIIFFLFTFFLIYFLIIIQISFFTNYNYTNYTGGEMLKSNSPGLDSGNCPSAPPPHTSPVEGSNIIYSQYRLHYNTSYTVTFKYNFLPFQFIDIIYLCLRHHRARLKNVSNDLITIEYTDKLVLCTSLKSESWPPGSLFQCNSDSLSIRPNVK